MIESEKKSDLQKTLDASFYKELIDRANEVIIVHSYDGKILSWNKKARDLFKWENRDMSGEQIYDLIVPERSRRLGKTNVDVAFIGSKTSTVLLTSQGDEIEVILRLERVSKGYIAMYITVPDIIKTQVDKQQQIIDSMENLLQNSNNLITIKDVESRYEYVNEIMCNFFDKSVNDFLGKTDFEIFPLHIANLFREADIRAMVSNVSISVEESFEFNNSQKILLTTRSVRKEGDVVTGVCAFGYDITLFKQTLLKISEMEKNEALESAKSKAELLANMSHEIRTPINGVMGMASLLLDCPLNSEQLEYVIGIQRSSTSLLSIIDDILDLSKIEAGKIDLEIIHTDIQNILNDITFMFQHVNTEKHIKVQLVNLIPEHRRYIKCDPGRLKQVFVNLVGNAIKFTPEGSVTVKAEYIEDASILQMPDFTLKEKAKSRDFDYSPNRNDKTPMRYILRFSIIDTGIGIQPELKTKLFRPFSQAETSTTRRFGGSGLGLSISKHLIKLMQGNIDYISTPGKGSTFWFEIPYIAGDKNKVKSIVHQKISGAKIPNLNKGILVVDDNSMNVTIVVKMLQKVGYLVDSCENGLQAVKLVAKNPEKYALILMDCQMPIMDGYEATKKIRNLAGSVKHIPIIAMTANALRGEKEICIASGMNDYISKPFDRVDFFSKIEEWLSVATK